LKLATSKDLGEFFILREQKREQILKSTFMAKTKAPRQSVSIILGIIVSTLTILGILITATVKVVKANNRIDSIKESEVEIESQLQKEVVLRQTLNQEMFLKSKMANRTDTLIYQLPPDTLFWAPKK